MKTRKARDLRIRTLNLVQEVQSSIGIDAFPTTPEGEAAALLHFHRLLKANVSRRLYPSLAAVKAAFPTVESAQFNRDGYAFYLIYSHV